MMLFDLIKTIPQYLIPKQWLTLLAGSFARVKNPAIKNFLIRSFILRFRVNMEEALIQDPEAFDCFNDFFIRYLKPGCRPFASSDLISPVDGQVSELGDIAEGQLIQAKSRYYTVDELLGGDKARAQAFNQGKFITLYLSPKDYHRVHLPINAVLKSMTYVPGRLFSVQPSTVRVIPKLFARNERLVIHFETKIGPMAMVLVGATIVGSIGTRWHGDVARAKEIMHFDYSEAYIKKQFVQGDEIGFFKLGSTVILLMSDGQKIEWDKQLTAGCGIRLGSALGHII